jgi:hypothetical protein
MTAKNGAVVFRCGTSEERLVLSSRDVHLLDGEYFLTRTGDYRSLLGLDFVRGLGAPPEGKVLVSHRRVVLDAMLQGLSTALADQRDLISFSYDFAFSDHHDMGGGGAVSGFKVSGLFGSITVRPSGYCTVTLSQTAPTGRGRTVEIIDMRVRQKLETDDWGTLTVSRRPAEVGWFNELPKVLTWLQQQRSPTVDVLHAPA